MVQKASGWLMLLAALAACGGEGEMEIAQGSAASAGNAAGGTAGAGQSGQSGAAGQSGSGAGGTAGTGGAAGKAGAAGKGGAGGKAGAGGHAGTGGVSGGGQAGAAGAGPVIRTVETRNPFGNVAASDNLLWDGDFEWSGAFVTQYPWVQSTTGWNVTEQPVIALGGKCRSGLKCAVLKANQGVAGVGMSPPATSESLVRAWARIPESAACSKVKVYLAGCFSDGTVGAPIAPTTDNPDSSGWCQFEGTRPSLDETPCVIIVNKVTGSTPVYVDDVYLGPAPATPTPSAHGAPLPPGLQAAEPPPSEVIADLRGSLRRLRAPKPSHKPVIPPPARVAR